MYVPRKRQRCNRALRSPVIPQQIQMLGSNRMGCDYGGTGIKTLFNQAEVTALSSRGNSSYLLNDSLNRGLHK